MSRARSVADLGNQNVLDLNASAGTLKVGAGATIENTGEAQFAGIITATGADFSGAVTVGGVLTYEDVTSIDSIGVVTARDGVHIVSAGASIYSPANNELALYTSSSERLRINSGGTVSIGGSVGIGTDNPQFDLQLSDSGGFQVVNSNEIALRYNMFYDSSDKYIQASGKASSLVQNAGGNFIFYNTDTASSSAGSAVTGLESRLVIGSDGKVAIGTDSSGFATRLIVGTGNGETGNMTLFSGTTNSSYIHFADGTSGSDRYRGYVAYQHNDDSLALGTDDVERLRIHRSGNITIGTASSSDARMNIFGDDTTAYSPSSVPFTSECNIIIDNDDKTVLGSYAGLAFRVYGNNGNATRGSIGLIKTSTSGSNGAMVFGMRGSSYGDVVERMRLTSDGQVLINTSTATGTFSGITPIFRIEGTNYDTATALIYNNVNDASSPAVLVLGKSRGNSVGSVNSVADDDRVGVIEFNGADGTTRGVSIANIAGFIDGTPGTADMPGRIEFGTTAAGANTPTTHMYLNSLGVLEVGASTDISDGSNIRAHTMISAGANRVMSVPGTQNNNTGLFLIHKFGENRGLTLAGNITAQSWTGHNCLFNIFVSVQYNTDALGYNTTGYQKQYQHTQITLKLVTVTLTSDGGSYLGIKKDGGGIGTLSFMGHLDGNMQHHGGYREINTGYTVTATHHTY